MYKNNNANKINASQNKKKLKTIENYFTANCKHLLGKKCIYYI